MRHGAQSLMSRGAKQVGQQDAGLCRGGERRLPGRAYGLWVEDYAAVIMMAGGHRLQRDLFLSGQKRHAIHMPFTRGTSTTSRSFFLASTRNVIGKVEKCGMQRRWQHRLCSEEDFMDTEK